MITRKQLVLALIVVIFAVACIIASTSASSQYPLQMPGHIMDNAGIFTSPQIIALNNQCSILEETQGIPIEIITVNNTGGQDVTEYVYNIRAGNVNMNNSTLIIVSVTNKPAWILSVGETTKKMIPDERATQIMHHTDPSTPIQNKNLYYTGVSMMIQDISNISISSKQEKTSGSNFNQTSVYLVIGALVVIGIIVGFYLHKRRGG